MEWGCDVTNVEGQATPPLDHSITQPLFSHFPAIPPPLRIRLVVAPEHPCPYLPNRTAQSRAFWAERVPGSVYHRFMDAGFRRSGKVFYQPACRACRQCWPMRVPVDRFQPSKSQRRGWRRTQELVVTAGEATPTDEKFELYLRNVTRWHDRQKGEEDRESFEDFLYRSPVETVEYTYRDGSGRLVAVGICDVCRESFSTVYFYHDPEESRRGLGTFGALYELEQAGLLGIPYYYLGYWIPGCGAMEYKSSFRPNAVLHPDGVWRPSEQSDPQRSDADRGQ